MYLCKSSIGHLITCPLWFRRVEEAVTKSSGAITRLFRTTNTSYVFFYIELKAWFTLAEIRNDHDFCRNDTRTISLPGGTSVVGQTTISSYGKND